MVYVHTQMVLFHRSSIMQFVASTEQQTRETTRGRSKTMRVADGLNNFCWSSNKSQLSSAQMFVPNIILHQTSFIHPRNISVQPLSSMILRHFMVVSLLLLLLITLRMIVAINPGKCPRSCSLKGGVEIIKHLSYKGRGSPRECRRKKVIAKLQLHILCNVFTLSYFIIKTQTLLTKLQDG